MTKLKYIQIITGLIFLWVLISGCSNSEQKDTAIAKIESDSISKVDVAHWSGLYQGNIPDDESVSLDMTLHLLPSNTYELKIVHLHKDPKNNSEENFTGDIEWAEDSTTLILKEVDSLSNKFRIKHESIEYLNPDATPNSGKLSEFYVLKKLKTE